MSNPSFIRRLHADTIPPKGAKQRIAQKIERRISPSTIMLREVNAALTPNVYEGLTIWERVFKRIEHTVPVDVFARMRSFPSQELQAKLRTQLLARLVPAVVVPVPYRRMKWVAAFAVFTLLVRVSPMLFIASPTIADSAVMMLPTKGEVSVSVAGLWQPVGEEFTVEPGMLLRTNSGEASILFHDDAVVRLAPNTTIQIHDTSGRLGPVATDLLPTLTLYTGELWVQGLVPSHVRGITISTSYGLVTVNEGSVTIAEDDIVDVAVFDRRVSVQHEGHDAVLVSGERTQMWEGNVLLVKKIASSRFQDSWPAQNLARDAVHRREIAQLQHERRVAVAGILPTSPFYSVKRIAETVDVLLTFDDEHRLNKRIANANTRLNEAAALISEDQNEIASESLAEYRSILVALAGETSDEVLTQFLLQQSFAEASADMAAALPADDMYLLKKAVLEASIEMDSMISVTDLQGILLMDRLMGLITDLENDIVANIHEAWVEMQPHLALLEDETSGFQPGLRKEIMALLSQFAKEVQNNERRIAILDPELVDQVAQYLPTRTPFAEVAHLTEQELDELVQSIRDRIFVFHMKQSRVNQLVTELRALSAHPDQGLILRRLYFALPDGPENFPAKVRKEITMLRWEIEGKIL
ncbi:MAG: DUF5667 domain-containing protein [bacterium]|nr:DUF5667 domain-containing protein [bacterium]